MLAGFCSRSRQHSTVNKGIEQHVHCLTLLQLMSDIPIMPCDAQITKNQEHMMAFNGFLLAPKD
jgi:hypothetical protein